MGNTVGVTAFHLEQSCTKYSHNLNMTYTESIQEPLCVCVCVFALLLEELEVI